MNLTKTQSFTEKLAKEAGQILLKKFGKSKIAVNKSATDFATDADLASEKLIIQAIKKNFPKHNIIAEESSGNKKKPVPCPLSPDYCWIIDPLDGTKNFHFGLPNWCVSIALQHKGKSVVGVVYVPVIDDLFSAQKNKGTKLNNKKIHVSKTSQISKSIALVEIPRKHTSRNFKQDISAFTKSLNSVLRIRTLGAAAYELCLVASGAVDGYLDFSRNTKIWDVAAGELIVREASGKISDMTLPNSSPNNISILASNKKLHSAFKKLL